MFEFRILRRYDVSRKLKIVTYVTSLAIGIIIFIAIEVAYGADPLDVMYKLFVRPITSYDDIKITLRYFIPIGLTSLGLIITYRAGIYSIGAEGQIVLGAIFTAGVAYTLTSLSKPISVIVALFAGALGGALWGLIPGLLRGFLRVNEVLTTLMLNFIAYSLTDYLIYGPWRSPKAYNFPFTEPLTDAFIIYTLAGIPLTGMLLLLLMVVTTYILLNYSRLGYEVRAYGYNPAATYAAGIDPRKVVLSALVLSGALAGLAGALQLMTYHLRLGPKPWSISEGLGYTSIIAAWLSRLEPIASIPASLLLAMLINGGLTIKASLGQPEGIVNVMNGVILLAIAASEFTTNYRVVIRFRGFKWS